jgi:amidase
VGELPFVRIDQRLVGRGGQTHNPYGIDRNPCGSSAGSGAAASANFAAVSLGTETDGSIVCPANANGVVGIKPTVGLTSRAGVVPISHTQDTVGPHGRTVADAAAALSVIQSRTSDGRDPATGDVPLGWQGTGKTRPANIPADYTAFLDAHGLQGARVGLTRVSAWAASTASRRHRPSPMRSKQHSMRLTAAGATVIDLDAEGFTFASADGEFLVLLYDFRNDVQAYFATRTGVPVAGGTLQTAIDFNNADAAIEMPFFNQDIFDLAMSLAPGPDDPQPVFGGMTYNQALAIDHLAGVNGYRSGTQFVQSRCGRFGHRQSGLVDRPDLRRPFHLRHLGPRGRSRLSDRAGAGGPGVRRAVRHQFLRHRVQRTDADQAGFRLRGLHAGARE